MGLISLALGSVVKLTSLPLPSCISLTESLSWVEPGKMKQKQIVDGATTNIARNNSAEFGHTLLHNIILNSEIECL